MRANKKRNIVLLIAIILTSFMLATVFSVAGSLITGIEKYTMYQVGTDLHGGFKYLTEEQFEKLEADSEINNLSYNVIVGQPINEELEKDYTEVRYAEEDNALHNFANPVIGNLPSAENEIATCKNVLNAFGLPYEVGQTIHLKINNGFKIYEGDFIVSGIWEKPSETLTNQIFVSKAFQEEFSPTWQNEKDLKRSQQVNSYAGSINPGFNFDNAFNIQGKMTQLKNRLHFGEEVNEGINWAYSLSSIDPFTISILLFLMIIIFFSGYLIISNIFSISIVADIQQYGLLKTIGTTNRQIKQIIIKQANMLSLVAIPLGLLGGYFASNIVLPIVSQTMVSIPISKVFNGYFIFLSALFSWLTVRVSCLRPLRIIKNVSPIEAVKHLDLSVSRKKKSKHTRKITSLSMAWQNVWRNKMKTILVISSMALSLVIFNITVSLVESFNEDKYLSNFASADFTIADASLINRNGLEVEFEGVGQEQIDYLSQINGLESIGAIYLRMALHKLEGSPLHKVQKYYTEIASNLSSNELNQLKESIFGKNEITSMIAGIDKVVFDQINALEGTLNWEQFKTGNYVIVSSTNEEFIDKGFPKSFYEVGDAINIKNGEGAIDTYKVMAVGNIPYAMGPEFSSTIGINILLPSDQYLKGDQEAKAMKLFVNINDDYQTEAEKIITELCSEKEPQLDFNSRMKFKEGFRNMKGMIFLIGACLSFILALIGILNFVNLIYTSINERRKELKTLNMIGMTLGQIKQMLVAEGVIRVVITYLIVLTIGLAVNSLLLHSISGQIIMFEYKLVIWPILISMPILLLIAEWVPRKIKW